MKDAVAWLFGLGMIANALLFVPQAIAIWRAKKAVGVSILTFLGFNAMQLVGVLHGYFEHDWEPADALPLWRLYIGKGTMRSDPHRSSVKAPQPPPGASADWDHPAGMAQLHGGRTRHVGQPPRQAI